MRTKKGFMAKLSTLSFPVLANQKCANHFCKRTCDGSHHVLKKESCRNKLREFSNCSYNRLRVLEKIELWNRFWWSCSLWLGDCCQSSVSGKWKHICEKKHVVWELQPVLFCFWKLYNQIQNFLKNQNLVFSRVSKMKLKFSTLCHAWNGLNEVGVIKPTRKTLQAKTVRLELFSRSTHRG